MSDLKSRILDYVKAVGPKEAGKTLGCAQSVVQRWVKGTHSPSLSQVDKFIAAGLMEVIPAGPSVPVASNVPLDIDSAAPILAGRPKTTRPPTVQPVALTVESHAPQGIQQPEPGDVVVDERISKKLPPSISSASMSVDPFGDEEEIPIVGPAETKKAPTAKAQETPRPINMPSGIITEDEYKRQMDAGRSRVDPVAKTPTPALAPPMPLPPSEAPGLAPIAEKPTLVVESSYTLDQLQQMRQILFNWQGKELGILCPIYKFVNPATNWVIAMLAKDLGDKGWYKQMIGDAVIENTRNKLADFFLTTNTVWSFWLDDDMLPPVGRVEQFKEYTGWPNYPDKLAGEHCIHRLLSHRKSIVGGTYFGRHPDGKPMFYEGHINQRDHMAARNMEDGIRPATWVATGCLLVNRQVYFDIQRTQPEIAPTAQRPHWDFFRKPDGLGEDVGFCLRAARAGHQPFVDTGLQCGHVGYCVYGPQNTTGGLIA